MQSVRYIRKVFAGKPGEFDPRKYLGPARDELIKMIKYKNEHFLEAQVAREAMTVGQS
jgi:fructose/tagatose bisphosphate aldolase